MPNGRLANPLHQQQKKEENESFWNYLKRIDNSSPPTSEFVGNLRNNQISFVLLLKNDKTEPYRRLLIQSGAKKTDDLDGIEVFDIRNTISRAAPFFLNLIPNEGPTSFTNLMNSPVYSISLNQRVLD